MRSVAAIVAFGVAAALAPTLPAAAGSDCTDVFFLGARGSGQPGPGSRAAWSPTPADPQGMGRTVQASLARLRSTIGGKRTIAVAAVSYPAEAVTTAALMTPGGRYWKGLAHGVAAAHAVLQAQSAACPDQRFVLAGYSQGAMVMHRLVKALDGQNPELLDRVAAVLLIGDGDRVSRDRTRAKYGSMHPSGRGLGLSPLVIGSSESSPTKFTKRAGSRVLEICNRDDAVCDYPAQETAPHLRYAASPALRRAAGRAGQMVLAVPPR